MKPDRYLWVDLETTGLDEHRDKLLEIGLVVTTRKLDVIAEASWQFHCTQYDCGAADEFVREMHTKNGLWLECYKSNLRPSVTQPEILAWISDVCQDHVVRLAGSGIGHFDDRWLAVHFPLILQQCMVGYLDVGAIRRWWTEVLDRDITVRDVPHGDHRAVADLHRFIAELKWMSNAVR